MNTVLYARVSTDKQADKDLSIPAQLQAMRDYARHRGWTIIHEFVEPGASARTADRPLLQQLVARCKSGEPKADVVLVHKIDRFARNVYDYATVRAVLKQHGVRLASVVENTDESVSGELVENIMASIAQFYSANLGEEARKGMRQKVLKGGWPHKAPRGYVSVRNADGRGSHLELHRRESALVRTAFEFYATGHYSVKALAERLARDGLTAKSGRAIAASYLRRLLTKHFYVGRIRWGGLDVAGAHPPLISAELFEQVQTVIANKVRDPGVKGSVQGFPLRGFAVCAGCRGRVTAERHRRWDYYRCSRNAFRAASCPRSLFNAKKVHADLEQLCRQIRITKALTDAIARAADGIIKRRVERASQRQREVEEALGALLKQEMQLTEAFSAGDVSPNVYRAKAQELRDLRVTLEKELAALPLDPRRLAAHVAHTAQVAASLGDLYEALPVDKRAELVREVFGTIVLSRSGIAGFALKPPFDQLASAAKGDSRKVSSEHRAGLVNAILDAA